MQNFKEKINVLNIYQDTIYNSVKLCVNSSHPWYNNLHFWPHFLQLH